MKFTFSVPIVSLFVLATLAGAAENPNFHLKDGDRVVFYGDSITDQRLYTTFTETYVVTRFPQLNLRFVHSGWGGDRVSGGGGGPIDLRLRRDVLAYKPTVLTIMLGMNDGAYRAFDQTIFDQYSKGYRHIISEVKKALPDIRVTLIQPSPYDDATRAPNFEGGYNRVLMRYGEFVKELAQAERLNLADLNTSVVAALEKAQASNPEQAKKIIQDRVHPGPPGQLLMAAELLKAWNAPSIVTRVEIDASGKRVVNAVRSKVTGVQANGSLSWSQVDAALPMPVDTSDPVMALAVKSSDFVSSLNQQTLKVTGLAAPRYLLKIDGADVGAFDKEQLAEGVNLAAMPTPMVKQAMEVHKLTLQHNDLHFVRWRQVQVKTSNVALPNFQKALDALDALEEDVVKQQRAAAQPVSRKYELIAQ